MRYRFAREGVQTVVNKHFFEEGSIKWDDDRTVPVVYNNDFSNPDAVLGIASDLRREDDGWITAEIEWNGKGLEAAPLINKDLFLTVYLNQLVDRDERTKENGRLTIHSGNLKAIFTAISGANYESDPWVEAVG